MDRPVVGAKMGGCQGEWAAGGRLNGQGQGEEEAGQNEEQAEELQNLRVDVQNHLAQVVGLAVYQEGLVEEGWV